MTKAIQTRRQAVRQGDIFRSVEHALRTTLRERLSRKDGATLAGEILEVQPEPFTPEINTRYPRDEPRVTMPNDVLRVLPRLPKLLSYRFVGRDLLLLDRDTALILDVLPDALPPLPGQNRTGGQF